MDESDVNSKSWVMPVYKHKCAGTRGLPERTQRCMGDEWSANCIFHAVPLCLCSPYTHYTTGNMCNASRRDFWQRGGGNNFRKPAPLSFLSLHRPSQRLDALMSAIDLVAGDNSFHRCDMPWWTGAPWTPWLIPALCSSTPLSERQRVGRLASILICHGWAAREALTLFSSGGFCGPHQTATTLSPVRNPDILTVWIYLDFQFGLCNKYFHFNLSLVSFIEILLFYDIFEIRNIF